MGRRTRRASSITALTLGATLALGVGVGLAQDPYPIDVKPSVVEKDDVEVLPATQERPVGAPDAADVDSLAATGADTGIWAAVGLGAVGTGAAALWMTRRRRSEA